jgi:hypothetical protein
MTKLTICVLGGRAASKVHLSHTERRLSVSHFLDNALHFLDNTSRLQCPFVTRSAEWVHRRGFDFRLGAEVALMLTR